MNNNILEICNLRKSFGHIKAVDDISFTVKRGKLFAFLGQNGAGKSTTIKIISTLLTQDSGKYFLNGRNNAKYIREKIGVVFQENVLDDNLTVKENLVSRGILYLKKIEDVTRRYNYLVEKLVLQGIENQLFKTLSGGQKRRVEIARALFSSPELLILDEPTTGLDPETRKIVWNIINELRFEDNITVFLTTHYMEEAANADYVVIINKGKVIAQGTPALLKDEYSRDYFKLVPRNKVELLEFLKNNHRIFTKVADQYLIEVKNTQDALDLIIALQDNIVTFEVLQGTLDDVFINVVGEQNG